MSGKSEVLDNLYSAVSDIGKATLSAQFPNDIEYYMAALELSVNGGTIDYFVFPVMPSTIKKTESSRVNVKTTQSGINVIKNDAFAPQELFIKGDFGRQWKFVNSTTNNVNWGNAVYYKGIHKWEDFTGSSKVGEIPTKSPKSFSVSYKSGYGCIKILQSIIDKSKGHDFRDADKPEFELNFYNMSLGESYRVVPKSKPLVLSQDDKSSNMIWKYELSFDIVAPLDNLKLKGDAMRLITKLSQGVMQNSVSSLKRTVKNYIS